MMKWLIGLCLLLWSSLSYAQYNVAPPTTCLGSSPNWSGSSWSCTTAADTVNTTSTASTQTAKQTLTTRSLPAAYLSVNGQCIRITAWGTAKATANNKTQTIDFGATTVASTGAVANNAGVWRLVSEVCRTSATAQAASGFAISATTVATTNTTPAETLANSIAVIVTSTNVTDTDGTTAKGLLIERIN